MAKFKGFTNTESFTQLPDTFFQKLLTEIEGLDELKVTLFFLWRAANMEGSFRALRQSDFEEKVLGLDSEEIAKGLKKALQRGSMLKAEHEAEVFYFLNSPRGRAGAEAFARGDWHDSDKMLSAPIVERPNVFQLYEENIGPLTPLIADALKDGEETYSSGWVGDAIEIAVKNNKRNWKYVEAILKRWKEEGRAKKQDRRDPEEDRRKYVEGEFSDYIEH